MSNPQTPDVPAAPRRKRTPKSAPARPGDGLTMYERAKLQIAERERKLKELQDKLMEDYTFMPHSTSNSVASSAVSSPDKVFDRLYHVETAAMRARRLSPRSATNSPARPRAIGSKDGYVTPTRLQELHVEGQNRLRARKRSQQEEDEERQRRIEEQELAECTFTPQTKWKLAAERRRKAREEAQRAADEARARSHRPKTSERDQWQKIQEEEELKKCTFKPKLKWNIAKERRNMARQPRTIWDDDDDDSDVPTQVPRTPRISTKATNQDVSPLTDPRPTGKATLVDQTSQDQESPEKTGGHTTHIKLVSTDTFQEESGKVTKAPTVVRSNYIGAVVPPSPEWKQKYKKIGSKKTEEIHETKGSAEVETMQVRSNFSSTIVAGGQKSPAYKKSTKKSTPVVVTSDADDKVDKSHDSLMMPPLAEQEMAAAPTVTPTVAHVAEQKMAVPTVTPTITSNTIDTVVPEANKSTPSEESRQSWLDGLLQRKGAQEQSEVAAEMEPAKKIDADMDALLSSAEASASAQADELSRKLADKDAAAVKANEAKNEAQEEPAENKKSKSKVSTWKQRLLGKRSKSKDDLNEATSVGDDTHSSHAGPETSETARLKAAEEGRLKAEEAARLKAEEEARLKAEEVARLKAEEEARLKAEKEARLKAEEEARLKAEEEARLKAEEEARLKAEAEARLKAEEEARLKAEEKARLKAEEDARLKAEEEARLKAGEEARLKAEEEARLKAEEEARLQAEKEARLKAEEEARLKAAEEARLKAEEDARLKAEEEARLKAEEEARWKAEEEARLKAEEEARLKAEEEARLKAEEEARLKAEEDARLKAEEEARLKAEEEARLKTEEEARLKAEEEARLKAEEEARLKAEEEARLKAEEEARLKAEEEARRKAEEEARLKAEEEARLKAEEEARLKAEEDARLKAEQATQELAKAPSSDGTSSYDGDALSTDDDEAFVGEKPKKSERAKKWKERLARKGHKDETKQVATADVSADLVDVRLEPPTEIDETPHEMDTGLQSSDDDVGLEGDDEGKHKKKSDRANKWKERLAKRTKGSKGKSKSESTDESTEKVAYPRVLLNEGEESQSHKEPEIASL